MSIRSALRGHSGTCTFKGRLGTWALRWYSKDTRTTRVLGHVGHTGTWALSALGHSVSQGTWTLEALYLADSLIVNTERFFNN